MKENILLLLLGLGLVIRLLLAQLPGFKIDIDDWFVWAIRVNEVGYLNFYSNDVFSDYLPGYLYILSFLGFLKNLFLLNNDHFYYLLKLPSITGEIVLALFVYKWLKHKVSNKKALLACSFILFNPAFIFNSSVWGQIDGLLTLFMILSFFYLQKNNLIYASIFFALSIIIKPQALSLLPIFGLYLLTHFSLKNLLSFIAPCLVGLLILSFPFFPTNPFLGLIYKIMETSQQYAVTSLFAYNFWGIVGFWIPDNTIGIYLSYQYWGVILFIFYWVIVSYIYIKRGLPLFVVATLATLSFYFLPTRVHERYLYTGLVFLTLLIPLIKSRLLIFLTLLLSCTHFLNLYFVYIYYNEFYFKLPQILYNPFVYNFLDSNAKLLSIISTLCFTIITLMSLKTYAKKD